MFRIAGGGQHIIIIIVGPSHRVLYRDRTLCRALLCMDNVLEHTSERGCARLVANHAALGQKAAPCLFDWPWPMLLLRHLLLNQPPAIAGISGSLFMQAAPRSIRSARLAFASSGPLVMTLRIRTLLGRERGTVVAVDGLGMVISSLLTLHEAIALADKVPFCLTRHS